MATPRTTGPATLDALGEALGAAATVLRANAMAAGLDAPVPTCPDWTVLDLVAHQGMVHRWAASHLRGEPVDRRSRSSARGASRPTVLGWFDDGATALLAGDRRRARRPRRVRLPQRRARAAAVLGAAAVPRDDDPRRRRARGPARPAPARRRDVDRPGRRARRHRRAARRLRHPPQGGSLARRPDPAARAPRRRRRRLARRPRAGRPILTSRSRSGPAARVAADADHALDRRPGRPLPPPVEPRRRRAGRRARALVARHHLRHVVIPGRGRVAGWAQHPTAPPRTGFARPEELVCRRRASAGPCSPPSTGPAPSAADRRCRRTARSSRRRPARSCPKRGFAYVAGSAGSEASAEANVDGVLPVAGRATDARRHDRARHVRRALRPPAREPPPRRAGRRAVDGGRRGRPRRRAGRPRAGASPRSSAPRPRCRWRRSRRALGGSGHWYQLYWSSDDDLVESLVARAEACGSDALVVTLDTAYLGWRPRDLDLGHLPFARGEGIAQYTSDPVFQRLVAERVAARPTPRGRDRVRPRPRSRTLLSMSRNHPGDTRRNLTAPEPRAAVETFLDVFSRPSLTWDDLPRLRALTSLPIVLKGILHPDDARRAVDAGVDGVYVSNHGGRQVDRSVAALDALPGVVEAVRGAGSQRAGHLRQRDPLRGRRLRRAGARRDGRRHRSAARLRPRPRRRRGRVRGAAQPAGRARPPAGAHRLHVARRPHPGPAACASGLSAPPRSPTARGTGRRHTGSSRRIEPCPPSTT